MIEFVFRGPTDTPAGLARFRDDLLRFVEGVVPPEERETAAIMLPLQHTVRFMQASQNLDRQSRELDEGLHPSQERLQEMLVEAQGLVVKLQKRLDNQTGTGSFP